MADRIYVDPAASLGSVIRVGDTCFTQGGESDNPPDTTASGIEETYGDCDVCESFYYYGSQPCEEGSADVYILRTNYLATGTGSPPVYKKSFRYIDDCYEVDTSNQVLFDDLPEGAIVIGSTEYDTCEECLIPPDCIAYCDSCPETFTVSISGFTGLCGANYNIDRDTYTLWTGTCIWASAARPLDNDIRCNSLTKHWLLGLTLLGSNVRAIADLGAVSGDGCPPTGTFDAVGVAGSMCDGQTGTVTISTP